MQVAVDHTIAGSQAISGRTPLFSHSPGTFNQSWVSTQPASRATPLSRRHQHNSNSWHSHSVTSRRTLLNPFSTISTTPLTTWPPPTLAASLSDVFQPSNPLPDSQDRS